nr:PREDICTED: transmembrane protein 52 isoform X1 [Lepisosteus oculatus]
MNYLAFTTFWLLVSQTTADRRCDGPSECPNSGVDWSRLWYVWLILMVVSAMLVCGVIASCVRCCCRTRKPPSPTFAGHPFEVTVVSVENENTTQSISTVSSYSVIPHRPGSLLPLPFRPEAGTSTSPPPYNLYALEIAPPAYEEALKMPFDLYAAPHGNRKQGGPAGEGSPAERPLSERDMNRRNLGQPPAGGAAEEEPPQYERYDPIAERAEEDFSDVDLGERDSAGCHQEEPGNSRETEQSS